MKTRFHIPLEDEVVLLRSTTEADYEALYSAASDREIWAQHNAHDRWKPEVFRVFFEEGLKNDLGMFVIQSKMTGKILGSTRYYKYDAEGNCLRIGYTFFDRSVWGTGVNTKVKKLMLDRAFQWVDRVFFDVYEKNFRSQKALKKLGAVPGERTGDKVIFVLDRVEWEKIP
ncbi:GNAT family N-acetyltransferase [Robertkochia flava]|uniref:GNAT family N-acetyltransferase n=1 Tax=Robertkochia flava TaxID=3447986 RepID=UPI001CCB4A44|nr:GNAT family N-acetyltransferase [Robertkochia marina]